MPDGRPNNSYFYQATKNWKIWKFQSMTWNDKSELRRSVGNLKKLDNLDLKKIYIYWQPKHWDLPPDGRHQRSNISCFKIASSKKFHWRQSFASRSSKGRCSNSIIHLISMLCAWERTTRKVNGNEKESQQRVLECYRVENVKWI